MPYQGLQYTNVFTATSSGGSVSFTAPGGSELKANQIRIINAGSSNPVYFNFTTTTGATTGDWPVAAGSTAVIESRRGYYTGLSWATSGVTLVTVTVTAIRS